MMTMMLEHISKHKTKLIQMLQLSSTIKKNKYLPVVFVLNYCLVLANLTHKQHKRPECRYKTVLSV